MTRDSLCPLSSLWQQAAPTLHSQKEPLTSQCSEHRGDVYRKKTPQQPAPQKPLCLNVNRGINTPRAKSKPLFLPPRKVWKGKCWGSPPPCPRRPLKQSWLQSGIAPLCLPPEGLALENTPSQMTQSRTRKAWRLRNKHLGWRPENGFFYMSLNKEKITQRYFLIRF